MMLDTCLPTRLWQAFAPYPVMPAKAGIQVSIADANISKGYKHQAFAHARHTRKAPPYPVSSGFSSDKAQKDTGHRPSPV